MILFIEKMFSGFWYFCGSLLLIAIFISFVENIIKNFFEMLPKLIHGQSDNFYIGTKDFHLDDKNEVKKAADKVKS